MEYKIEDFTRCPNSNCNESEKVAVDYYHDGDQLFFNFRCLDCGEGSLEDDFRWYVKCPNCNPNPEAGVDHVSGEIENSGIITFTCQECGLKIEDYVTTRWDSSEDSPDFEPYPY